MRLLIPPRCSSFRCVVAVVVLLGLLAVSTLRPLPVAAHANLVQSDPPAQAVLQQPPSQVQLLFSEAVDPRSIEVSVLDVQRRPVDRGDAALISGTRDSISVSLNPGLPDGVYTIQWKVTSAVDGHTTRGLIPFTVGDPGTLAAVAVPPETTTATSGGLPGIIGRWLTVLAAVTLVGSFAFVPLMLAPALRMLDELAAPVATSGRRRVALEEEAPTPADVEAVGAVVTDRLLRIAGIALGLLVLGMLVLLWVETHVWSGATWAASLGAPLWDWLTGTRRGGLWLARAGLTLAIAAGLFMLTRGVRARGRVAVEATWPWALCIALGAGALAVHSLGSHSAALRSQQTLATAMDWLHLLAVALWVGGIVQFGLALLPALGPLGGPPRTRLLAGLIPRFTRLAAPAVTVIALTGVYQTVRLLGGLDALTGESWGRALLIKLLLFLPLLGLAAFNLLVISPRMRALAGRLDRSAREAAAAIRFRFRRALLAEVALAMAILGVVGVLTGVSPKQATGFRPEGPFRPFVLTTTAEDLSGRLVLSPGRIGLNRFDLEVRSSAGPLPQDAEVLLRVTTLDRDTGVTEAAMQPLGGGRFTTTGTYLSTVGLWEVAALIRRPGQDEARLPFRLSLTEATGQPEVRENRPAAPIERGREIYIANCAQCHGSGGRGDGPLAPALNPRPVDLTVHVPLHTDRELDGWISNGIPRTAMPAFADKFSPEEIQAVINYLRQLADQANKDR